MKGSAMFTIKKNARMPTETRGAPLKYPFNQMEVGDSFTAAVHPSVARSIKVSAYSYGKRHDRKFATRTDGNAITVWRVS